MTPAPPRPRDPREVITEDALSVHPSLLGMPLAAPWRRAVAMSIDLVVVLLLSQATAVLLGVAAAIVLFRASSRKAAPSGYIRRSVRFTARFAGAVALFVAMLHGWGAAKDRFEAGLLSVAGGEEEPDGVAGTTTTETGVVVDGLAGAAGAVAFRFADNQAEARERGEAAIQRLKAQGVAEPDIHAMLSDLARDTPEKPWLAAVADSLFVASEPASVADADSLALAYGAALSAGDSVQMAALRPLLTSSLAAGPLAELRQDANALRAERDQLRDEVSELEQRSEEAGIFGMLKRFADDLGLGMSWGVFYFTTALALWRGQTLGKRLLRIRVIRLNAKPIGWWASLERFGGYWAGIATGLLGFLQILWHPNRQGIHDKISETAVVRE